MSRRQPAASSRNRKLGGTCMVFRGLGIIGFRPGQVEPGFRANGPPVQPTAPLGAETPASPTSLALPRPK
jgi:hypothetical protein